MRFYNTYERKTHFNPSLKNRQRALDRMDEIETRYGELREELILRSFKYQSLFPENIRNMRVQQS